METTNEKLERMEVRVDGEGEPHTERVRKQKRRPADAHNSLVRPLHMYPPVDWT